MADSDRLIHYICTAASHHRSLGPGLTRHGGHWALCPDLIGEDHEWRDTGGLEVHDAVIRWRQIVGGFDFDGGPTASAA
ncbi:MAG: hypothetical protein A3G84_08910 [Chloroflexi bacterium RIFCSPLOWO2_12_FULL_71_12]|nr:MAG: hypothetical protein A3G84_08910 [Chloroflexi bacterium RIFCSPLOWO2_12_FULL_71_12]